MLKRQLGQNVKKLKTSTVKNASMDKTSNNKKTLNGKTSTRTKGRREKTLNLYNREFGNLDIF
jgi:hypothetical protein